MNILTFTVFYIEIAVIKQRRPRSDAEMRRLNWVYAVCIMSPKRISGLV